MILKNKQLTKIHQFKDDNWRVVLPNSHCVLVGDSVNNHLIQVDNVYSDKTEPNELLKASLVSSAPEMYLALIELMKLVSCECNDKTCPYCVAEKAIEKADSFYNGGFPVYKTPDQLKG